MKKKLDVDIDEYYEDFSCPFSAKKTVENLLFGIPQKYYNKLGKIMLTNSKALNRKARRETTLARGKKYKLSECCGWYNREWKGKPSEIVILVDNVLRGRPKWELFFPLFKSLALSDVLFHELGHHIHRTMVPEYKEKEDVADRWQERLSRTYYLRRYWYTILIFVLLYFLFFIT